MKIEAFNSLDTLSELLERLKVLEYRINKLIK